MPRFPATQSAPVLGPVQVILAGITAEQAVAHAAADSMRW
jgi:hypothetical protein